VLGQFESVLKGHEFARAISLNSFFERARVYSCRKSGKMDPALATEGWFLQTDPLPGFGWSSNCMGAGIEHEEEQGD
jgi:hypothetical protein